MSLSGQQYQQLQNALLNLFDHAELKQMVRVGLNENLAAIAGGSDLSAVTFNLIEWAGRRGRTAELIQRALDQRPDDADLLALQRELGGDAPTTRPSQKPAAPPLTSSPSDTAITDSFEPVSGPDAFAYNFGDLAVRANVRLSPVHSALLHLSENEMRPLVTVELTNQTNARQDLQVQTEVKGYSYADTRMAPLAPGATLSLDIFPTFDVAKIATVRELTRAALHVRIVDLADDRARVGQDLRLQLLAINSAPLAAHDPATKQWLDQTRYFGAFVTPNDTEFDDFINEAANHLPPGHSFNNYQSPDVTPQVQALFDALAARGTVYVDSTMDLKPADALNATQRVRLPKDALTAATANCIDGTLLMASLLERVGIEPAIILLSKHALLGWAPFAGSDEWSYLETTLIGRKSFADAHQYGERKVKPAKAQLETTGNDGFYRCWPLRELRAQGITPVPKVIGDELGRIARALEKNAESSWLVF